MKEKINIEFLRKNNCIIYEFVVGSKAYGTSTPQSDEDKKFIYVLPKDCLLGTKYVDQINVNKDYVGYEIKRFLELLAVGNPTMMELIGDYPQDCVLYKNPVFDLVIESKSSFITKKCKDSFMGYATQQIRKASGLNKKQNWEHARVTRKTPLDFCYVISDEKAIPLKKTLKEEDIDPKFCGLVNVPHARDLYCLYYDQQAAWAFSELYDEKSRGLFKEKMKKNGKKLGLGYKGLEVDNSNAMRLSSIPKGEDAYCNVFYNCDGYQMHCREYKEYEYWKIHRNESRYADFNSQNSGIDGKNMLHCRRLLDMAKEIAEEKGIIVRRPNAEDLLKIRRGEVSLKELITHAEKEIKEIDKLFDNSKLPNDVDPEFIHELLVKIRKQFYASQRKVGFPETKFLKEINENNE